MPSLNSYRDSHAALEYIHTSLEGADLRTWKLSLIRCDRAPAISGNISLKNRVNEALQRP